jgi:hypothetical protein
MTALATGDNGLDEDAASIAFMRAVASLDTRASAVGVGLEAEYLVRDPGGARVDFRGVIHRLGLGPRGLDPNDVNAYRLASSTALTCDLEEAELALCVQPMRPGFTGLINARIGADEAGLARRLAPGRTLDAFTTHVSVSVERHLVEQVAWTYAETFGPAAMLMMDGASSPGFLVRPRAGGRVELCGWYLSPGVRTGALVFAAGSILACADVVGRRARDGLPAALVGDFQPAAARHGWYLDRRAFGPDLYAEGRRALLRRQGGGTVSAQRHLESCWALARAALAGRVDEVELDAAAAIVGGDSPLACEVPGGLVRIEANPAATLPAAAGLALPRRRGWYDLAAVALTWHFAVFVISDAARSRRAYALVPAKQVNGFIHDLDRGRLDDVIRAYLRVPPVPRLLALPEQTEEAGLYDELPDRTGLLWPEIEPSGTFIAPLVFGTGGKSYGAEQQIA